ncbi:MAG: phosphatase PAP2 family protein [Oligoflexia bacterium]|nr:phosphatase PAP2 family protein [Oligoflexia bacterium]
MVSQFKKRIKTVFLFICAISFTKQANATIIDDFTSPVTTPAKYVLLTGSIITIGLVLSRYDTVQPVQRDFTSRRHLGKWAKVGEVWGKGQINLAYVGLMVISAIGGNKNGLRRAKIMTVGSLFAVGATAILKETVGQPRPNDGRDKQSFPSGHATGAFAFASVVGAEHGALWGIPAYAIATFIAWSRINDNKHYLHDVVGGATIGMAYGLGVYYSTWGKNRSRNAELLPLIMDDGVGALATIRF